MPNTIISSNRRRREREKKKKQTRSIVISLSLSDPRGGLENPDGPSFFFFFRLVRMWVIADFVSVTQKIEKKKVFELSRRFVGLVRTNHIDRSFSTS